MGWPPCIKTTSIPIPDALYSKMNDCEKSGRARTGHGPTLTCVVSGALMELTPLPRVLFWLRYVVLCLRLWRVVLGRPALAWSFVRRFGSTFSFLLIRRPKVSLLLFELLLNLGSILVCCTKRGDVEELHFLLNVSMKTTAVL
jgi:hypothetical protein